VTRRVPLALLLVGAAIVVGAVMPDVLGRGYPGLGLGQLLAEAMGFTLVFMGAGARTPDGMGRLAAVWGAPRAERASWLGRYAIILLQLGMLLVLMRRFQIENQAFWGGVAVLGFGGFAFHFFVPSSHRMRFFLLLCLAAIYFVLGLTNALWVVALGGGLICICHLPFRFGVRVGLLLAAGALLAMFRIERLQAPWSAAVWPILASMFMFRLITYAYDLRHAKERPDAVRIVSYFFLMPNVLFPLFPVVDFSTFRRTYYDADEFTIYQRGVRWMVRGVVQLIAYRIVYQYVSLAPNQVGTPAELVRYLVANVLLYLRVSGQFHLITGLLHLFGFHLPRTNNRYFLASSFAEYWRRINIYWKDFMMKVVFYPSFFALRRYGETTALALSTLCVVGATWALHSYQWFWLLGNFPVTATDLAFWGALGILLCADTVYNARKGKKAAVVRSWATAAALEALRVGATFTAICLLWSLWTSASISDWLALWEALGPSPALGALGVAGALVGGTAVIAFLFALATRSSGRRGEERDRPLGLSLGWTTATFVLLVGATSSAFTQRLGPIASEFAATIQTEQLNQQDATRLQQGYYEQLNGVSRVNSKLWEVYAKRPVTWPMIEHTAAGRSTKDYLYVELVPSKRVNFGGITLTTNAWAMRDHEYARAKPPRTFRLAVIGASTVMGWRVGDDEGFEPLLERRLEREASSLGPYDHVESLNFAIPGYVAVQFVTLVDRSLEFAPDAVLLITQDNDLERTIGRLVYYAQHNIDFPDYGVRDMALEAARGAPSVAVAERRLHVHAEEVLTRLYRAMAERCRAKNAKPVWVYLPALDGVPRMADREVLFRAARSAGFTIVDLTGVYDGHDRATLTVDSADYHPNAEGHRLIAQRLYDALMSAPNVLAPVVRPQP
jgi:hypothetical protein